jgi:hypothetical protein
MGYEGQFVELGKLYFIMGAWGSLVVKALRY